MCAIIASDVPAGEAFFALAGHNSAQRRAREPDGEVAMLDAIKRSFGR